MTVSVNSKSDPRKQEHRMQSLLRRISPEEEHLAYVLATYRDVAAGLNIQDNLLCQLTVIFLNGLALPPQEKQSASIYTPNSQHFPKVWIGFWVPFFDAKKSPWRLDIVASIGPFVHEKEWKNAWLSAGITWKSIGDDLESAFWESANIRESVGEAYENLYYTPVTCSLIVMLFIFPKSIWEVYCTI